MSGGSLGFLGGVNYTALEAVSMAGLGAGGAGALRNLSGSNTFAGAVALTADGSVGADAGTLELTGSIGGSFGLTKFGPGTVRLSATNNYTGATTVTGGTLLVNSPGNLSAGGGTVTVSSGATLGGTGTINRPVVVNDGAILAPGASPGTLTLGAGLALNNASLLNYELGTSGVVGLGVNDLTVVTGNFTLDGILNVTQLAGFGPQPGGLPGIYRLFNYSGGTFTDNGLLIGSLGPNSSGWIGTIDLSTSGQVNLSVIPEPATLGLLALGGLAALRRRPRRA